MEKFLVAQVNEIPVTACPCGLTRRAFTEDADQRASVHLLDVQIDAQLHYHKKITEVYFILQGEGFLELDGERVSVKPMTSILIKPGCRHRAVGELQVVIVAIPTFDVTDEWFD